MLPSIEAAASAATIPARPSRGRGTYGHASLPGTELLLVFQGRTNARRVIAVQHLVNGGEPISRRERTVIGKGGTQEERGSLRAHVTLSTPPQNFGRARAPRERGTDRRPP